MANGTIKLRLYKPGGLRELPTAPTRQPTGQAGWDIPLPKGILEKEAIVKPTGEVFAAGKQVGWYDKATGGYAPYQKGIAEAVGVSKWYEKPKEWAEAGMEAITPVISKVPVLPEVMKWAAPAFEFIHEKLEDPWAAAITAPFSPALPYLEGESWIEHQKREYEMWDAPTYIKGAAEFAMPLWWIPWLGWAGKGTKAMVGASRLMKSGKLISKIPEQVLLPSYEKMGEAFSEDIYKKMALWAEHTPVVNKVIEAVGGPAAFIKRNPQTAVDKGRSYVVFKARQLEMGQQVVNVKMDALHALLGNKSEAQLLKITEETIEGLRHTLVGVVTVTAEKPGVMVGKRVSMELDDVITHPDLYAWTDDAAYTYVKKTHEIADFLERMALANGVKIPKRFSFRSKDFHYIPRIVEGVERGKGLELVKYSDPFKRIVKDTAFEGVESGVKYGANVSARVELMGNAIARRMSNQIFDNRIKALGETMLQRVERFAPEAVEKFTYQTNRVGVMQKAVQALKLAKPLKGGYRPIHGTMLNTISAEFPELASKMANTLSITPSSVIDNIGKMSLSAQKAMGMSSKPLVEALKALPEKASLDDALRTVMRFTQDAQKGTRWVESIYKQNARAEIKEYGRVITELLDDTTKMLSDEKTLLAPLKTELSGLKKLYGEKILGKFEAKFPLSIHAAFGGRIFSKEVVDTLIPLLETQGNKWVKDMANLSATSRLLVATLDLSAAFIQGTLLFGKNPVVWAKSVGKMLSIAKRPQNLYRDLALREASRMDRILHGGLSSSIDYFEAMPLIRKWGRKIAGVKGEKIVTTSYGRAEAAFMGFGEIARDEMWKVGRFMIGKKGLAAEAMETQLNELARGLDRMTGVMSTRALGIGLNQQNIESAFVFFAPRYTRAGFSYFADMLKGGFTGAEARTAMAGMMLGGITMYEGVCSILGKQPNYDPTSAKFMTAEIGGRNIGIGGFTYSAMRAMADVAATAATEPGKLNPLNFDRVDNPFYKFMFSKAAPLTGITVGLALEQKNFLGEPFETPADYFAFLADKVTPIAIQTMMPWEKRLFQDPKLLPVTFGAEIAGLRTFPQSEWDKLKVMKNSYAQKEFGKEFDELNNEQRDAVFDKYPKYQELAEEAKDRMLLIKGEDLDINLRFARQYYDAVYNSQAETAANSLVEGVITYRDYLDEESALRKVYRGNKAAINFIKERADPEAQKSLLRYLEEQAPEDKALNSYNDIYSDPSYNRETGLIDWDATEKRLDVFLASLAPDTRDYVLRNRDRWLRDIATGKNRELREMQVQGRDIVDAYYNQPEGKARVAYRRANPTVDAWLLAMGRVTSPQTAMAMQTAIRLLRERGIPETILAGLAGTMPTQPVRGQVPEGRKMFTGARFVR